MSEPTEPAATTGSAGGQAPAASTPTVSRAAVVGAGLIGLSWASLFAAEGLTVKVWDPRPDLAEAIAKTVPQAVAGVPGFPDDPDAVAAAVARVIPVTTIADAVADAELVQEAGPERANIKQANWKEVEAHAPADALLLSSSSGIVASVQSELMVNPLRLLIGHPFNPPHVLPLVEVSADEQTDQALIDRALAFYRSIGKHPVQLHKEVPGFVANRIQAAVIVEAIRLVDAGVVNARELDDIVTNSLGIRWASVGPLLAFHLGGGEGGLKYILEHIGKGLAEDIGQGDALTDEVIAHIGADADREYPHRDFPEYIARRDRLQKAVIAERQAEQA